MSQEAGNDGKNDCHDRRLGPGPLGQLVFFPFEKEEGILIVFIFQIE
jgi:hypothetical protein